MEQDGRKKHETDSNKRPCLALIGGEESGGISASARSSRAVLRKPRLLQ